MNEVIWFDKPAAHFGESIPIGNGRLGAMLFGGREEECIILNEATMWSGCYHGYDRKNAYQVFPKIKELLLQGKNKEANELCQNSFTSLLTPEEDYAGAESTLGCYQMLGTLRISMHQNIPSGGYSFVPQWSKAEDYYRRELDIEKGIAGLVYTAEKTGFQREAIASAADQVIVLHFTAKEKNKINMRIRLDRPEKYVVTDENNDELLMTGQLENGVDHKGVKYACRVLAVSKGGTVSTQGCVLVVRGAEEATLIIAAATDMKSFADRKCEDVIAVTEREIRVAAGKTWSELLDAHTKDYQRYYHRTKLSLGGKECEEDTRTTPERIKRYRENPFSLNMIELFFNYGKYLYISANRKGNLPSNLQGIWAEEIQTMFNGDWHIDAQQENHWMAEVLNLSELHMPYLKLIAFLQESGSKTAKEYYDAEGWVAHIFTNPWGFTSPGASVEYGATMGGSGWMCQHLWDHYLFTKDADYLQWMYPILKGAVKFYHSVLFTEPIHGWLVTGPTISPENRYYTKEGDFLSVCMGATYDMQIIRYLFQAYLEASELLGTDEVFREEIKIARSGLAPTRIGDDGRIMEWLEPYKWVPHRHISHLWGLYPGNEITPDGTKELAEAALKVIHTKTAATGGWALAHRMNAVARLKKGNEAADFLAVMIAQSTFPNLFGKCHQVLEDGSLSEIPAFEEYRVPFQIDANYACVAGIAEMLLQSHECKESEISSNTTIIHILPALPDQWKEGNITGLCARGGIQVSIEWREKQMENTQLTASKDIFCMIKYNNIERLVRLKQNKSYLYDRKLNLSMEKDSLAIKARL